jgi:hypothetical protein
LDHADAKKKEEDFVTNTYSRKLLPGISTEAIQAALLEARILLRSVGEELGHEMVKALDSRLELRYLFLNATQCSEHMHEPEVARKPWKDAVAIIPDIGNSHTLGKAVDEAFSAKLQRKLASTMPPRPIVQIGFEDAFGHLIRLFQDGSELIDVLNYTNSQALQVSHLVACSKYLLTGNRLLCVRFRQRNPNLWCLSGHSYKLFYLTKWRFWDP